MTDIDTTHIAKAMADTSVEALDLWGQGVQLSASSLDNKDLADLLVDKEYEKARLDAIELAGRYVLLAALISAKHGV